MRLCASFLEDLAMRLGVPPHPNPQPTNLDLVERVVFSPLSLSPPLVCSARMLFALDPMSVLLIVISPFTPLGLQNLRREIFTRDCLRALQRGVDPIARDLMRLLQFLRGQEQFELGGVLRQARSLRLGRFKFADGSALRPNVI